MTGPLQARLGAASSVGLGLAAVGRPGYINLGRATDLPPDRTVAALEQRTHQLLDAAVEVGVRYVDVARSYGRAEEFLASWLDGHTTQQPAPADLVVGSKWGYTYTAGWRTDATTHEVKEHSVATFARQWRETERLLGRWLAVYQVHSVTPDSPVLSDPALHRQLAGLAERGITVGFSSSGPQQAAAIEAALRVTVDGAPLFRSVQATFNVLEPSVGIALSAAADAGCAVIVKEAVANGRLASRTHAPLALQAIADELGVTPDAVAIAFALRHPGVNVVLSGAATVAQLRSNLAARAVTLRDDHVQALEALAEPPQSYWEQRARLPWS